MYEKAKTNIIYQKIKSLRKNSFRKNEKNNHENVAISEAESEPGYV